MKFTNQEIGLSVEMEDGLIEKIKDVSLLHYPKEFGGVLVGQYLENGTCVLITDMILPKKYTSTRFTFDRGVDGLSEILEAFFKQNPPIIYVGEWHTHPDAQPVPSRTDAIALNQIVTSDAVNIDSPVMLIIGLTPYDLDLALYVYFNKRIYQYEIV